MQTPAEQPLTQEGCSHNNHILACGQLHDTVGIFGRPDIENVFHLLAFAAKSFGPEKHILRTIQVLFLTPWWQSGLQTPFPGLQPASQPFLFFTFLWAGDVTQKDPTPGEQWPEHHGKHRHSRGCSAAAPSPIRGPVYPRGWGELPSGAMQQSTGRVLLCKLVRNCWHVVNFQKLNGTQKTQSSGRCFGARY